MKKLVLGIIVIGLSACASDDDKDETNPGVVSDCVIESDSINLASGESCNLTEESANLYSTTAGEVECNAGVLVYANSTFSTPTSGITFNGLTFVCAAS